jgi:hypothetical protein
MITFLASTVPNYSTWVVYKYGFMIFIDNQMKIVTIVT